MKAGCGRPPRPTRPKAHKCMFFLDKIKSLLQGTRHQVLVEGHGTFTVRRGAMLLDALLGQGVAFPHLCKLGDCARCKSVALAGSVRIASNYPGALGEKEKARRVFLACRATPYSDCHVAILKETTAEQRAGAAGNLIDHRPG